MHDFHKLVYVLRFAIPILYFKEYIKDHKIVKENTFSGPTRLPRLEVANYSKAVPMLLAMQRADYKKFNLNYYNITNKTNFTTNVESFGKQLKTLRNM